MSARHSQQRSQLDAIDCLSVDRRRFMKTAGLAAVAASGLPLFAQAADPPATEPSEPESIVKVLYESLTPKQKQIVCFGWEHQDADRGLLRARVENNWQVTSPEVNDEFYSDAQRDMIKEIFKGIIHPDWHDRYFKQMEDDAGGFGNSQAIAIFGEPGNGKFQFLFTGRHMTLRCDGNSAEHLAFGGPLFYGHAAENFFEAPDHPGNVFWPQAVAANNVYKMLDGKQRRLALVKQKLTPENRVAFQGKDGTFDGIPVTELSADQKKHLQQVLGTLLEPFRQNDRDEALSCLKSLGGLDACSLAYYTQGDIGQDGVWDNWRLEGPSFVWSFRGAPHVHVWVNVADSPTVKLNA